MKKKIVPFILSLILIGSINLPAFATSTNDLNNQKNEINDKISEAKEQQKEVKEQLSEQMQEISNLDVSISQVEEQIKQLEAEIAQLESSIKQEQEKLEEKQREHQKNQELMEERLVVMYEQGETSFLDMLFSSQNIVEFISNYYLISQVTECDRELLDTIEKEQEEIENTKTQLEEQKGKVDSNKRERETKNSLLRTQKAQRQEKANALSEEEKKLQNDIEAYKQKVASIDKEIEEAIRKAMEQEKNQGTTGGSGSKFDGTFCWPLDYSPRRVTSGMKIRWGRWHKGIDIGTNAEVGKRVVAAASGTVIYSAYQSGTSSSPGYGNYLIIYHGGGFASLYAHMQSKAVSAGTYVSQGQTVGYSGNTGGVAPHLHFEIRKASSVGNFFGVNNWLDPLDYLPGGYTRVD